MARKIDILRKSLAKGKGKRQELEKEQEKCGEIGNRTIKSALQGSKISNYLMQYTGNEA